jgi:hypothetical protein
VTDLVFLADFDALLDLEIILRLLWVIDPILWRLEAHQCQHFLVQIEDITFLDGDLIFGGRVLLEN